MAKVAHSMGDAGISLLGMGSYTVITLLMTMTFLADWLSHRMPANDVLLLLCWHVVKCTVETRSAFTSPVIWHIA